MADPTRKARRDPPVTEHDRFDSRAAVEAAIELPGYSVFDIVGRGGAGVVYRAQRNSDGQVAAVKVLRREYCFDSLMLSRFEREIQAISMLEHPNIVKVYDVGRSTSGRPFYAMEFLRGQTMRDRIQSSPRLSIHQAVSLFSEVGYAISYAHDRGIVHRDLKSTNIILTDQPDAPPGVKLVDFGVAKFLDPQLKQRGLTRQGALLGSTSAMSPEQIRGQPIDRRADIYGLGVMLFELLTGELPFLANNVDDLLRMHLERPPPLPSQRHRPVYAFDAVVQRALQKRREDRFDSAREMVDAVQLALQRPGLRPKHATRKIPAIGFCARIEGVSEWMEQRSGLQELVRLQRRIAHALGELDYVTPISTLHTQLGLTLMPDDPSDKLDKLERAKRAVEALASEIEELVAPGKGAQVRLTLHVDEAETSSHDERFVSGPILAYEDWSMTAAESPDRWVRITPMFLHAREQATLACKLQRPEPQAM